MSEHFKNAAYLEEWLRLVQPVGAKVAPAHFEIDGYSFGSIESFSLVILLPEEDSRRTSIASLDPKSAALKRAQLKSEGLASPKSIHWNGREHSFGSEEHVQLMKRVTAVFNEHNPNWRDDSIDRKRLERPTQSARFARHLPDRTESAFNIGVDPEGELLSNFARTPFAMGGISFASVEAFVQYIKYPTGAPRKEEIPELAGKYAKRTGKLANEIIEIVSDRQSGSFEDLFAYWEGDRVPYRSPAHLALIRRALELKFSGNRDAREQLVSTGQKKLVHDLGYPESRYTSLPASEFCRILTDLRNGYTASEKCPHAS